MTTPAATEQFVTLARRGQEATTAAAQAVTEAFKSYTGAVTPQGSGPIDPQAVATATFDLADRLLRAQRRYVGTTISLLTEAGETVTAQASAAGETLKARTEEATTRVVDLAAENTRRAATAARNGVSV
jgi:hypothetical protein